MTISQPHALPTVCCPRSISLTKSLNPWVSCKDSKTCFSHKKVVAVDYLLFNKVCLRNRCRINLCLLEDGTLGLSSRSIDPHSSCLTHYGARRMRHFLPFASADDGVTVNGDPQTSTNGEFEEMRVKLDQSLQNEEYNSTLIQSLHDAARVYELAIKDQSSESKFSTAWLGIDQNAWVKALSYQASVYSLLLAACEISSRGDRRDRDINVFVQRSLSRHSAPLESVIRDALSDKQPELYDWFWSEQVPSVVSSFVNYFEKDQRFVAATGVLRKGTSLMSGDAGDISLLLFALSCIAAIIKTGPTKVACTQFYSVLPDITGRLMDMLVEFVPIHKAYSSIEEIGLRKEFLVHFGPRAAACRVKDDQSTEEVLFWVSLVQKQLERAIDRERIWSRLTTCESIEVLDSDLAIFGFFIALGRRTRLFLSANNIEAVPKPIEGLIRHLIDDSMLYYPQLSSLSSYQLYVEVVCEELDWLPFYPGDIDSPKGSHVHRSKQGPPKEDVVSLVLDVCSHWIQSFIKYSKWLENPSNVKAARFHQTMQEVLQFPPTTSTPHHNPPPKHHLPLSCPTTLHLPPPPSSETSLISVPVPPKPSTPLSSATNTTTELQEKLIYLDSFGIDLIPLLTTHPPLVSTSLSHIKSTISFLSSTIPLSPPALNRLISLCPEVLTLPLPSIISTITFLLREAHVRSHHLRRVIHRRPRLLTSDVKTRLRPTLYFLQGTIGISEIHKHTYLLSSSVEDKLLTRIEYFHENIGISYNDTILIFRRFPSLFCYSIKDNLEPKFNYLVTEMGRDLKELVEFPQYFSFSLENRIKPRHRRCMEKGVCLSLPAMLRSTEKQYLDRLEMCCGSSMPVRNSPFWYYTHSDVVPPCQ